MPELREVFEMTTKQVEPDLDAFREQEGLQRRSTRNKRIWAFAVAAAIGLAAVALFIGTRVGHHARPANQPPTVAPTGTPTSASTRPTFPVGADRVGLVGLAPEGAKPSLPERGELVLGFTFGHTSGDQGRFRVFVYADGRLIWQRFGDPTGADEYSKGYTTGLLEQRLTPEGVELVRAEAISTGLFDRDLHMTSGQGLTYGAVDVRKGDLLVHVAWGDVGDPGVTREMPTPEQASALRRLDARLADPASWLPASAWEDPKIKAYVPSGYSVCYHGAQSQGLSQEQELSLALAPLPPAAADLLRTQDRTRGQAPTFVYWCSNLTNEEARALARILDDAGLAGVADEFGLRYEHAGRRAAFLEFEVSLEFEPLLPHEA
jgi:hypothetical protein